MKREDPTCPFPPPYKITIHSEPLALLLFASASRHPPCFNRKWRSCVSNIRANSFISFLVMTRKHKLDSTSRNTQHQMGETRGMETADSVPIRVAGFISFVCNWHTILHIILIAELYVKMDTFSLNIGIRNM